MPTLDEFAAMQSIPTLSVRVRSGDESVHVVLDGMTIGRGDHNAIVIDSCDVCVEHARIIEHNVGRLQVACAQDDFWLTLPSGNSVSKLSLEDGAEFWIGDVRLRFQRVPIRLQLHGRTFDAGPSVESQPSEREAIPVIPAIRAACPRCHDPLARIPTSAKFCPKCGLELPEHCPPWMPGVGFDLSNPALIAYANALFNLGIRFENDGEPRDLEQARRYFEKAAKLGLTNAKARLETQVVGDPAL